MRATKVVIVDNGQSKNSKSRRTSQLHDHDGNVFVRSTDIQPRGRSKYFSVTIYQFIVRGRAIICSMIGSKVMTILLMFFVHD